MNTKIVSCLLVQTLQVGKGCETKHHRCSGDFHSALKEQMVWKGNSRIKRD